MLTVSRDHTVMALGAGNIWVDVYNRIVPMGLTVIGGRVSNIGVGGLTLGGGISFFSGHTGWACDNVNNYQVRYTFQCKFQLTILGGVCRRIDTRCQH